MEFHEEETTKKYVTHYLREQKFSEEEIKKKINSSNSLEEELNKAKLNEAKEFSEKYVKAQIFSLETSNEAIFTLNEIKKYIDFRVAVPEIDKSLIMLFIFAYHFNQPINISKIIEYLDLPKQSEFIPVIDYDEDKKKVKLYISKNSKEFISVSIKNPGVIEKERNIKIFESLTKSQKHCFIFLICCIKAKKVPIIQGKTASGKSFLIQQFAKLLGQESILYQMNSNTGNSLFTGQEIIKEKFDKDELKRMKKAYNNIKKILKEKKEFEKLKFKDYKKLIKKIDKKIKKKKISFEENEKLNKARRIFFVSTSAPSRFSHKQSAFITAIKEGKWVILDGIEMSQIQISEKITTLCDESPEINILNQVKECISFQKTLILIINYLLLIILIIKVLKF